MSYINDRRQSMSLLFIALLLLIGWACNDRGIIGPGGEATYDLGSVAVIDHNTDMVLIAAALDRNDSLCTTATLTVGDDTLQFDAAGFAFDSVYSLTVDSVADFLVDSIHLGIVDLNLLDEMLSGALPDSFSITSIIPANHQIEGNESASISWTGSARAEGYVVAAVKADQTYAGLGYTDYSLTGVTAATIPPDAFLPPGGDTPDTGLYNLYVYALTGTPDSALSHLLLPAPMPSQLTDGNLAETIRGTYGSVVVALKDTVRVVAIQ